MVAVCVWRICLSNYEYSSVLRFLWVVYIKLFVQIWTGEIEWINLNQYNDNCDYQSLQTLLNLLNLSQVIWISSKRKTFYLCMRGSSLLFLAEMGGLYNLKQDVPVQAKLLEI